MARPLLGSLILVLAATGIGLYCWTRPPVETLEPIQEADTTVVVSEAALPAEAIAVDLAEVAKLEPPFVLSPDVTAAGGRALALPKGTRDKDRSSRARIPFMVRAGGSYSLWLRAYWKDSCSNSISARMNDAPEKDIGNDELFNVWHWVPAGTFTLKEGTNELVLREREDGVALDQMLLVHDPEFQPTGRIEKVASTAKKEGANELAPREKEVAPNRMPLVSEPKKNGTPDPTPPVAEPKKSVVPDQTPLVDNLEPRPAARPGQLTFTRTVRRFADDFTRSPGHGMGDWRSVSGSWEILFSFDPNRIPLQYALNGKPDGTAPAVVLIKGPPWNGARLAFSIYPQSAGSYGVVLDRSADGKQALQVVFNVAAGSAKVTLSGNGAQGSADLKDRMRLNQWHAITIERWAWVLSICIDETPVLTCADLPLPAGDIGFMVTSGAAAFDDVKLDELAWQADDGKVSKISWKPSAGAAWFRRDHPDAGPTLLGRGGMVSTGLQPLKIEAVLLDERVPGACRVDCAGLVENTPAGSPRLLHRPLFGDSGPSLTLAPVGTGEVQLRRVAVAYCEPLSEEIVIGPYTFNEWTIPDPSDYIDFTPEEHAQMRSLPEAEKYRRGEKPKQVIAHRGDDNSPWYMDRGRWQLVDKMLQGIGPGAQLTYADEFAGDFELRMKVRLPDISSAAQVLLCGDPEKPYELKLVREKPGTAPGAQGDPFELSFKSDGAWHQLCVRISNTGLAAAIDDGEWRPLTGRRGDAGFFALGVKSGRGDFDDVEFRLPRRSPDGRNYSFMPAETDWWREATDGANWSDHGGISCRLASSWISLAAPKGSGMIWNKQRFGPDVAVATDITEWSEWYGWDHPETHRHLPYDNICLALGTERDGKTGYRLEVNSNNRTETVLYRNNQPVARVAQDGRFPMHYVGGHYPYYPRRHRISLIKRGSDLQGIVDGKIVVRFTDPEPLPVSCVGLGGYQTHINFGPIHVRQITEKPPATPPKS